MPVLDTIYETYRDRLAAPDCYTELAKSTQDNLAYDIRRYGLHPFDKVGHGILAFCIDKESSSSMCLPWLVDPFAPPYDISGGRHGLVKNEFSAIADKMGLGSQTQSASRELDYFDDFIATYIVKDDTNEAPFTVICSSTDTSNTTPEQLELVKALSIVIDDHMILINPGGDTTQRSFIKIRDGSATELPYGSSRGLKHDTIAAPDDIVGRTIEMENYAAYARKHGLSDGEFSWLVSYAVTAFHEHRQVSLDKLCEEILAERRQYD